MLSPKRMTIIQAVIDGKLPENQVTLKEAVQLKLMVEQCIMNQKLRQYANTGQAFAGQSADTVH